MAKAFRRPSGYSSRIGLVISPFAAILQLMIKELWVSLGTSLQSSPITLKHSWLESTPQVEETSLGAGWT